MRQANSRPEFCLSTALTHSAFDVTLIGIAQELYCRDCGERLGVSYPNLEEVVAALALARAQNPQKLGGAEVRFIRQALKLTARELAARLGVHEETISHWEQGRS